MRSDGERPHVAIVTGANLQPGAPGGTRSYVLGLGSYLASRHVPVDIVSNGPAPDAPAACAVRPVRGIHTPSAMRFQRDLRRWAVSGGLRAYDVVHFQRPDDASFVPTRLPMSAAVCTLHGDALRAVRRRRGALAAWAYARLEARAFPSFRAAIAVDATTAEAYRRRYPDAAARIRVIPIAVDPALVASADPAGGAGVEGPPRFLYAGRLSIEKRVDRIIDAVADRVRLPDASLVVAGSGPDERRLRSRANGASVRFEGNLDRAALAAWYRRADAVVLASEYEGLPSVALEALAVGCPVVALRGCGVDALLADGGGVLADGPDDLARALAEAVRLRRGGARVRLPDGFTWDTVGPRILDVYRTAMGGGAA
ncbi:MAG: glycosyltransferase family 4 protein [Methanobacteriota archaeon]